MANVSAPFGLRPVRYRDGKPYLGQVNRYTHDSGDGTALYVGDPVIIAGNAGTNGYPTVIKATAGGGSYISGVVVGFEPQDQIPLKYGAASTTYDVLVADDPSLLFEIQEDSVGGNLAATNVAQNADWVAGSGGSTITGLSSVMLDSSTAATTNTLQLKIHGWDNEPSNETPGAYGRYLVSINLHQLNNTTGV